MTLKKKVFIIDDEAPMRRLIKDALDKKGFETFAFASPLEALDKLAKEEPPIVISDIRMPEMDGIEFLKRVKNYNPEINVILITGYGSLDTAVRAIRGGALDYILKPFRIEALENAIEKALHEHKLTAPDKKVREKLRKRYEMNNIIGGSKPMQEVFDLIEKVARQESTVLITGESGTGKELVARAIHYKSRRHDKPFVSINCAAMPHELLESELFGHEKGSFTGAVATKIGLMELAEGGTFFLDEVGETSPGVQVKLLRVLQEREIKRVGGLEDIPVDIRIIAATSKNLIDEIGNNRFREDFFYRLNVIPIYLPPLRERPEDVPFLIEHFRKIYTSKAGLKIDPKFTQEGIRYLKDYSWPGNVRELENIVERVIMLTDSASLGRGEIEKALGCLLEAHRPKKGSSAISLGTLKEGTEELEKKLILKALEESKWNKQEAAKKLQLSRRALYYKLEKYGL
ncbi:MAG: sigma-54 dependent transcriptional regulator [Candidatus Omnitrophica bacterium]|nr:sigma-54 dependent transcriptional regulator [Candidatus Omnitrophota bacterium]